MMRLKNLSLTSYHPLPFRKEASPNYYVNIHIKCVMLRIILCEEKGLDALFI